MTVALHILRRLSPDSVIPLPLSPPKLNPPQDKSWILVYGFSAFIRSSMVDGPTLEAFQGNQIKLYFHVACACTWICDYTCGILDEKSLIWGTPWKAPKILYFLTRYLPFVSLSVHLYYSFTTHNDGERCKHLQTIISGFTVTSMFFSDLTFTIRTWAVWQPYRKKAVVILFLFSGVWISRIIMLIIWLKTLDAKQKIYEIIVGCHVAPKSKVILPFNIVFAAYVGVLFGLMSLKAYKTFGNFAMKPEFYRVVYLDGSLYYLYLFILSLIDLTLNIKLSMYKNLISILQQFTFSILACRLLLHLRRLHPGEFSPEQTFGFLTTCETGSVRIEETCTCPGTYE